MRLRISILILLTLAFVASAYPSTANAQNAPTALQGSLTIIGYGAGSPDDLAVGADDTIYFSDLKTNQVLRLRPDGTAEAISPTIRETEGIVQLADGSLIVVEQASNRLYRVNAITKTMAVFYSVGKLTHNDGIDGIAPETITGDLLIPHSPTGRILHISVDTRRATLLLSGFARPTSAVRGNDGLLYVCDEFGGAIYRVDEKYNKTAIAHMSLPDDVILDQRGDLLVNSLDGSIWQIDPETDKTTRLVMGLKAPHGIGLDSHGNIIIADAGFNEIFRLTLPGLLL